MPTYSRRAIEAEIGILAASLVCSAYGFSEFPVFAATVIGFSLWASFTERSWFERGLRNVSFRTESSHGIAIGGLALPCLFFFTYVTSSTGNRKLAWNNLCLSACEYLLAIITVQCRSAALSRNDAVRRFPWILVAVACALSWFFLHWRLVPWVAALICFQFIFSRSMDRFAENFTFGEIVIVAQLMSLLIGDAVLLTASKMIAPYWEPYLLGSVAARVFLEGLVLGLPAAAYVSRRLAQHAGPWKLVVYLVLVFAFLLFFIFPWMWWIMNTHPVRYLVIRIMSKRAFGVLLPFWVICLVVFVFLAYLMRRANVRLLFIRKVFHLLALCLFIPGIMVDPSFMSIAFSCAFGLFLLIEATPAAWIAPMRRFMQEFTDERDNRGKLILTHVYLLMGCGMSLWIYGDNRGHRLILYSGLLALGVGDTMACIAGVLFGRHRITKTTSKTWEGFAANFISVFAAAWCLAYLCGDIIRPVRLLSAALFSAGIEASCPHLDNLVLPLFAHIFFAVSTM